MDASVTIKDAVSPELYRLLKKSRNMSVAMAKIENQVMRPLRSRAWLSSGLKSQSGELKNAVKTWHGKKSAGVSVKSAPGKDLVIPKATTHMDGARKHQWKLKKRYKVRSHRRAGMTISAHLRKNAGAPWGAVKARPFIPRSMDAGSQQMVIRILEDFIDVRP